MEKMTTPNEQQWAGDEAAAEASPEVETDEETFFDRERWRAVGDDLKNIHEESAGYLQSIGISMPALLILIVVVLLSGMAGLLALTYLPRSGFLRHPIPSTSQSDYRTIPLQWIGYRQIEAFPLRGVANASCFYVSRTGRLFVGNEARIFVFDAAGHPLGSFPTLGEPKAITSLVHSDHDSVQERLFIALQNHIDVYQINSGDRFSAIQLAGWKSPEGKCNLASIAFSELEAMIYVGDAGEKIVYKYDLSGKMIAKIGGPYIPEKSGVEPGAPATTSANGTTSAVAFHGFVVLAQPHLSVAVSPKGLLHVANPGRHRVETFTFDGVWEPSLSWGDVSNNFIGFCACCNPTGLATLPNGQIVTIEKAIDRVKIYEHDGRIATVVAGPDQLDRMPAEIVDQRDRDVRRSLLPDAATHPLMLSVVDERIFLFDPLVQIVRIFERNTDREADPVEN